MSLPKIAAADAHRLLAEGAVLIDIREAAEHAHERIPGARHVALSEFDAKKLAAYRGKPLIFHCHSGARTKGHAARLKDGAPSSCAAYILDGGILAWRKAGLPVASVHDKAVAPRDGGKSRGATLIAALLRALGRPPRKRHLKPR